MKGFKVINGDVSIIDGDIRLADGVDLEMQTITAVLKTNKGEDVFDSNEGINLRQIIGKGVTEDMAKTQIKSGLNQIDTGYTVENFDYNVNKFTRTAQIKFTARKSNGVAINIDNSYN